MNSSVVSFFMDYGLHVKFNGFNAVSISIVTKFKIFLLFYFCTCYCKCLFSILDNNLTIMEDFLFT